MIRKKDRNQNNLLDVSGLPMRLTAHLNVKTNKYKAPRSGGKEQNVIDCPYCTAKMHWDREVGSFFCSGCVYSQSTVDGGTF